MVAVVAAGVAVVAHPVTVRYGLKPKYASALSASADTSEFVSMPSLF